MNPTSATLSVLALLFVLSTQAFAVNFTVNQLGDGGDGTCDATCTLRDAVDDTDVLPSNDTIDFAPGITTIFISTEIQIANNGTLGINGPGADILTINGGPGTNRIFTTLGGTVTISGVTLTGGNGIGAFGSDGGAIYASAGSVTLNGVHVTGNVTSSGGAAGAMFVGGSHQIINSTFSANVSSSDCGGFYNSNGTVLVTNSTISGNSAAGGVGGGGICSLGTTSLRSSTVTGNVTTGVPFGAIVHLGGDLSLGNTIVARNPVTLPDIRLLGGTVSTVGYNLIGNGNGFGTFPAGNPNANQDIAGTGAAPVDPLLAALGNYGGPTPTHRLTIASPAVDKGRSFGLTTDQRGSLRPVDRPSIANNPTGDAADIGAYELQAPTAAAVSISGRVRTANGRGIGNVRVALMDSAGNTRYAVSSAFGYYLFEDVQAGDAYVLSVSAKRYRFNEPTRIVSLMDSAFDVDFIGQ